MYDNNNILFYSQYVSILRPPLTDGEPLDKTEWQQVAIKNYPTI